MVRGAFAFPNAVKLFSFCCLAALLISCSQAAAPVSVSAAEKQTRVFTVVLARDERLSFPRDSDIRKALDFSSELIDSWYHVRTEFRVTRSVDVDSYVMSYLGTSKIPEQWYENRFAFEREDSVERFESGLDENSVSNLFSAHNLRQLVRDSEIPIVSRKRANAIALLNFYKLRLRTWQDARLKNGSWLIDRTRWQKHSLWFWDLVLRLVEPERVTDNIIIMNTPFIDDDLAWAPPHSLIRGGLLNGYVKIDGNQVLISTFPIYSDLPFMAAQRDGALSDTERILSLAIIIGHEVGAHFVKKWNDSYGHTGCLAEPARDFNYHEHIRRLFEFPRCVLNHDHLNVYTTLAGRFYVQAVCRLESGDTEGAIRAAQIGADADPHNSNIAELLRNLRSPQ